MADQGKNEAAKSLLDLQPTVVLELFKLHADFQNRPEISFAFHGGSDFSGNITWQGVQYAPLPVETEGFGVFADGTLPRPKIRVGNANKIVTVFLEKFGDFKNAAVFRKKVFLKHLDDVNFDGGNPFGVANPSAEISEEKYFIGQKTIENSNYVEFELNSPLDLDNFRVNERTISAKYCYWQYRGQGCQYAGKPIEKADGQPFTDSNGTVVRVNLDDEFQSQNLVYSSSESYKVGDVVFLENRKVIVGRTQNQDSIFHKTYYVCVSANNSSDPKHPENNISFWQKDGCSKRIQACQKRYAPNSSALKRVYLGEEDDKSFKYIHNKLNNSIAFFTENDKITGSDSPFSYEDGTGQFTILYSIRKPFSSQNKGRLPNGSESSLTWESTANETICATAKLERTANDSDYSDSVQRLNLTKISPLEDNLQDFISGFQVTHTIHSLSSSRKFNELSFHHDNATDFKVKTTHVFKDKGFVTQILEANTSQKFSLDTKVNPLLGVEGSLIAPQTPEALKSINGITNQSAPMANFLSLFGDSKTIIADQQQNATLPFLRSSFQGDIMKFCAWSRKLTNQESILLATTNLLSSSQNTVTDNNVLIEASRFGNGIGMPVSYSELTGSLESLKDGLIVWYDMETGFLDAGETVTGILDEHTGEIHLSGYGESDFEQREFTYTPAKYSAIVPNQTATFTLPFGGFPGTDGYDYESRGTS